MSGDNEKASAAASPSSMLARAEQIQRELNQLSGRDLQLWSIGALVIVVLTAGLLSLIFPNLLSKQHVARLEQGYLPQLFFGLTCLIVLFNIYILGQKRALNATRRALVRELVLNERLESLSLIDPLTQLLNRRAMDEVIAREVARANRMGTGLSVMVLDIEGFRSINSRFGNLEGDQILLEFTRLLREVFRGADVIFRQGGDEFLVVMPDTTEEQADYPQQRLTRAVDQWNLSNNRAYELSFNCGVAGYVTGADVNDVLRTADRRMYQRKHKLVPVF